MSLTPLTRTDEMKLPALSAVALAMGLLAAAPAQATVFSFQTLLSSAGEPVPTSTATGAAIVNFDDVANSVTVLLSFSGLANAAPFAHIHCCTAAPGVGGAPVALGFTAFPAATTASYIATYNLTPVAFGNLLAGANAGLAYINIHTPGLYQGGEIRGFLPAIPEPGTYALMALGLVAVGGFVRRRQQQG